MLPYIPAATTAVLSRRLSKHCHRKYTVS